MTQNFEQYLQFHMENANAVFYEQVKIYRLCFSEEIMETIPKTYFP